MKYNKSMAQILKEMSQLKEEDHEISMARGELEAIADKALKLSSMLKGKSEDEGLEAWVQSKITKAKDYVNSVVDYMEYNPEESVTEADLTKKQIKMVHKTADDLPKKDFKDRYGNEKGDAVRYATATNMVKKKLGMKEEVELLEAVELEKDKIDVIKSFTNRNQHYEARAYICQMMKDSRLKSIYNEVGSLQDKYNKELGFLLSRNVRDQLDKTVLLPKLKRTFKNWNVIYSSI